MTWDGHTSPEKAAEIRQLKRYRASIEKKGTCSACVFRNKTETYWGRSICSFGRQRQHSDCDKDGKSPQFKFDPSVLEQFRDKAA